MSYLSLKSLLRTAKERQRQERLGGPVRPTADDCDTPTGPSPPNPPRQPPHEQSTADYLSVSLFRPLPPPSPLSASHRVQSSVAVCYYVSQWCSEEAESDLLRCCVACPPSHWVQLKGRSLQCWGNTEHAPAGQSMAAAATSGMPAWLNAVVARVQQSGLFAGAAASTASESPPSLPPQCPSPDHVLINRYEAGQGIFAHRDGPAYEPLVAILSLASHTVMHFYRQPPQSPQSPDSGQPLLSLLLEPRSLLVFSGELYTDCYHAIHELSEDVLSPRDVHNWPLLGDTRQWQASEVGSNDTSSSTQQQQQQQARLPRHTRFSLTLRATKEALSSAAG